LGDSKNTLGIIWWKKMKSIEVQNDNLIEIADALGDMMYILVGL
jgi:hypothetical protein